MRALILAGAMTVVIGTVCFADELYWVVGNGATNECDIVTSNPIQVAAVRMAINIKLPMTAI
jgi:hypothetical protein